MRWVILPLLASAAFCLNTHVIPETDLCKRVKMIPIATEWFSPNTTFHSRDFGITFRDDSWHVAGRDKNSKPWTASLLPAARSLWETDLNGVKTYYFFGYSGAAGIGLPSWMLALTFDALGRPNPFYLIGYMSQDKNGVADLLDLDGTGPQFL